MSSDLYEVLGLDRNATAEDIRKAYRKRALKTHPDRLPQGVSEAERQEANDQFRLVNNAYEVLNDTNNRKLYDQYGVWPPPTADAQPQAGPSYNNQDRTFTGFGGSNPFTNDPFFNNSPFGHPFHFTDPFELFTSFFGDIHRPGFSWGDSFDDSFSPFMSSPFGAGPPGAAFGPRDPWGRPLMNGFGPFGGPSMLSALAAGGPNVRSYSSTTQTMGGGGNWVSQSTMSRTVNGRTETITTRRDAQGNEHVTRTSQEGETYTINGVEQPSTSRQPRSISAAPPPQPFNPYAAQLPPPMQNVVPPMNSVSRTSSQHSYSRPNYPYDQPDVNRRSSGSSHRKMHTYEDGVTRSSHDGHRPSRDDYYDPYRTRASNPNYDSSSPIPPPRSSSSQRRSNTYAGVTDNGGHHVGDSGSRHRDEHKHDGQRRGW